MNPDFTVILFYKYVPIVDPENVRDTQRLICQKLNLKGRIIVAEEGINATIEGTQESIEKYIVELSKDSRFANVHIKKSIGTGQSFPKLSVKYRSEIVAYRLGKDDVKPWETTGQYIYAEGLHDWIKSGKKFLIVDMRNDFEQAVGFFENSILTQMEHSQDLPIRVQEKLSHLPSDIPIVTVCTGGVRCEKASGYLLKTGFNNVFQLYGGIVTYMEKYPGEDFMGVLYTFDKRLVMGFNLNDPKRTIVGKCAKCQKSSENLINCTDQFCHRHFIACLKCLNGKENIFCPMGCRDYSKEHPELNSLRS
jgi:UPF0176 protein